MIKSVYWFSCKVILCYCQIVMKLEIYRLIFEKYSNIIFHFNPSIRTRAVPCGRTDTAHLIVAFRNFSKAPKSGFQ
jgi:hypothetical protein